MVLRILLCIGFTTFIGVLGRIKGLDWSQVCLSSYLGGPFLGYFTEHLIVAIVYTVRGKGESLEEEYFSRSRSRYAKLRDKISSIHETFLSNVTKDRHASRIFILLPIVSLVLVAAIQLCKEKAEAWNRPFPAEFLVVSSVGGTKQGYRASSIEETKDEKKVNLELADGTKMVIKGDYLIVVLKGASFNKWRDKEQEFGLNGSDVQGTPKDW